MDKVKTKKRYRILFFMVRKDDNGDGFDNKTARKRIKLGLLWTLIFTVLLALLHTQDPAPPLLPTTLHTTHTLSQRHRKSNDSQDDKQEKRHIAFLKVHKAASSTIQNILFRFGTRRNLTFVLPTKEYKFSEKGDRHHVLLDPPPGGHYDILALHSVFNYTTFSRLLPADTAYIAIVRDPLDLIISSAFYNRDRWGVEYLKQAPAQNFIQNLIRFPEKYDPEEFSLTKNIMARDFGFPSGLHVQNADEIKTLVHNIGQLFNFVMVVEHFAESLVLLKRYLNWDTESILYISVNENTHKSSDELNIKDTDRRKFRDRNFLDYAIYDYFYERFISELSRQDGDFFAEVDQFKATQRRVEIYCLLGLEGGAPALVVGESRWHGRFVVTPGQCEEMRTPELQYIDLLRGRHLRRLYNTL